MWEIVKTIVSAAKEALEIFRASKAKFDAQSKHRIGYDLFIIYIQLNDLLISGDRIVDHLETFADADLDKNSHAQSFPTLSVVHVEKEKETEQYLHLQDLIMSQLRNIEIIIATLAHFRVETDIVGGNFRRLIIDAVTQKKLRLRLMLLHEDYDDFATYIPKRIGFSLEQQQRVREYLRDHEPRKRLDEIQALLEMFRSSLEKNFSISDILVRVRDKNHQPTESLHKY